MLPSFQTSVYASTYVLNSVAPETTPAPVRTLSSSAAPLPAGSSAVTTSTAPLFTGAASNIKPGIEMLPVLLYSWLSCNLETV